VAYTPLIVVIFHEDHDLTKKNEEFSTLFNPISDFLEMHKELLDRHLAVEHYSASPV
jgi:hypothetical protein